MGNSDLFVRMTCVNDFTKVFKNLNRFENNFVGPSK